MKYNVFAYNCYEDFYVEDAFLVASFDSLQEANTFIDSEELHNKTKVISINDKIKWFFPSCNEKGELVSPSLDDDIIECYQMVYVEPENHDDEWEPDFIAKYYILDYLGNVKWC